MFLMFGKCWVSPKRPEAGSRDPAHDLDIYCTGQHTPNNKTIFITRYSKRAYSGVLPRFSLFKVC